MVGAIVGAAVLGTGAAIYSANKASSAIKSSTEAQLAAQGNATAMQLQYLREVRADIADAVEKGLIDIETGFNMAIEQFQPLTGLEEYNTARQLLQDPSAIMDRPSTQFQYGQGLEALQAAYSKTSGGGVSGPAMKGAIEYGQNFASAALDAELNRLFPFINSAISARTNIANLYQNTGTAQANLRVGGATGNANIVGQMMPAISQGITQQGNIAAGGTINQANIQTGLYSNLANQGTNMAMLYAMNPSLFSGGNTAAQQGIPNTITMW